MRAHLDRIEADNRKIMDMVVAEASHYLQPFIEGREDELSASIRGLLGLPRPALQEFLVSIEKRDLLAQDMVQFFDEYDLPLCPRRPIRLMAVRFSLPITFLRGSSSSLLEEPSTASLALAGPHS